MLIHFLHSYQSVLFYRVYDHFLPLNATINCKMSLNFFFIQVIELLPLRFLPPNEKIQVIFALHLVISCCPVSDICPDDSNLVCTVPNDQKLSLITNCIGLNTLMMSPENVFIYNYLRPEVMLNFLETSLSKIQEQVRTDKIGKRLIAFLLWFIFQQLEIRPITYSQCKKRHQMGDAYSMCR